MTWLFTALGLARKALTAVLGLARRYPLAAALIASLCLSAWLWHGKGKALDQRDQARAEIAKMQAKAKAIRATTVTIAKESDHAHEARLADNRGSTVRYIERNRVRPQSCPAAEAETAGPSESPAPLPVMVAVSEPDVKTCGDLQTYAQSAYEWGQAMVKAGVAD